MKHSFIKISALSFFKTKTTGLYSSSKSRQNSIAVVAVWAYCVLMPLAVHANTTSSILSNPALKSDSVYVVVDKMPEFPGGEQKMFKYIYKSIVYPKKALKDSLQGKVIVEFVVTAKGKPVKAKVIKSLSPELDKEALRVIDKMPNWIPGMQDSVAVAVKQIIPIKFQISTLTPEEAWEPNDETIVMIDSVRMPDGFNVKILNPSKLTSYTVIKPFPEEVKKKIVKQFGKQAVNGVILITTNKDDMYYALADTTVTSEMLNCTTPTSVPVFKGGNSQLFRAIADSIQYPFVAKQTKTEGKVTVKFKVNTDGSVSDASIVRSVDYFLDKEAIRVINSLPASWTPGEKCGHKLSIFVTMPVSFKLDISAADRAWERNENTIVLLDGKRMPPSFDLKWLNYANLSSYKVLQPSTAEQNKKLIADYGKDAINGVVLIESLQ